MAKGGDVSDYCAQGKPHQAGCEYFADGGAAGSFDSMVEDSAASAPQSKAPSFDNLVDDSQKTSLKFDDLKDDQDKYGTTGQQIGAGIEGLAQGVAGPLATMAEKGLSKLGVPGLSDEDIRGRAEANPWTHGIAETAGLVGGSLIPGVGAYTLGSAALKAGEVTAGLAKAGSLGTKLITGAIASGALQASDEATKYMIDDPTAGAASAVAHIGAAGLFGLGGAAAGMGIGKASRAAADSIANMKLADRLRGFGMGLGTHATGDAELLADQLKAIKGHESLNKGFELGKDFWGMLSHSVGGGGSALAVLGAQKGYEENGIAGAVEKGAKGLALGAIGGGLLKGVGQKVIAPVLFNAMRTGNFTNLIGAINHQAAVAKGVSAINSGVDSLFTTAVPQQVFNSYITDQDRKDLKDYISNGGINQNIQQQIYQDNTIPAVPQFAEGGIVDKTPSPKPKEVAPILDQHPGVAEHFPTQNVILNTARGRISNYLSGIQPQENAPKLAFDTINKDKQAAKSYDKAIDIALNPLSVLQHVKSGTIEPEQIKHLNMMYPEVMTQLQKKLTDRITQAQIKNEKPEYRTRIGMSMMLGTALDSTMTPASIQAIQMSFAPKQPDQQGPQGDNKGSKKALEKVAGQYRMGDESRILNKAKG